MPGLRHLNIGKAVWPSSNLDEDGDRDGEEDGFGQVVQEEELMRSNRVLARRNGTAANTFIPQHDGTT